jgi:hypothetical protein
VESNKDIKLKILAWVTVALLGSLSTLSAFARSIDLVAETACQLIFTQGKRLDAAAVVFQTSGLRAQGLETPASKAAGEQATKDLIQWTTVGKCHPVTGRFKVLDARPLDGARAMKIEESKGNTVWVMQP